MMKKLLATLPSTKPDYGFKSEASEIGFVTSRKPRYESQLETLLSSMAKTCQTRLSFLFRDFETICNANETLFKDLLKSINAQQLWNMLNDKKSEQIGEEGQIKLLVKLLEELNQRKMHEGDLGNIEAADKYRKTIEWFIPAIVKYEENYLNRHQEEHMRNWRQERDHIFNEFNRNESKTIEQFDRMDQERQNSLLKKFSLERSYRVKEYEDKLEREIYKINPSQRLKDTKEKALLRKLGTYRLNKINPYEDEGYAKDIQKAVESEQLRKMMLIEHLKRKEKERVVRQQKKSNDSQQMHAQHQRDKMLSSLSFERTVLDNYEQRLRENMKHQLRQERNRKLNDLRKSLQAFIKHEDSEKIKEILVSHQEKIRHNNDIAAVASTQAQVQAMSGRYSTIGCQRSTFVERRQSKHKGQFEHKISLIFHEQTQPARAILSGRKSLVDLYDKEMQLL